MSFWIFSLLSVSLGVQFLRSSVKLPQTSNLDLPSSLRLPLLSEGGEQDVEGGVISPSSSCSGAPSLCPLSEDSLGEEDYRVAAASKELPAPLPPRPLGPEFWRAARCWAGTFCTCMSLAGWLFYKEVNDAKAQLNLCAADVIGKLVDEGCMERAALRLIPRCFYLDSLSVQRTGRCSEVEEEVLGCCPGKDRQVLRALLGDFEAEERMRGEMEREGGQLREEGWCEGHRKYASFLEE